MSSTGTSIVSSSFFFCDVSTIVTGRYSGDARSALNSSWIASSALGLASSDPASVTPVWPRSDSARLPRLRAADRRGRAPPRKRATSSSGRCVADRPMRCSGDAVIASSRSIDSARCAPRLVGTSAWISSTMTVSTDLQRLVRVRRQEEIERFRRRDQDVGRLALEPRALGGGRVSRADRHRRRVKGVAARRRAVRDPGDRRPQVALDVDRQRLQRRDVEHAAAACRACPP